MMMFIMMMFDELVNNVNFLFIIITNDQQLFKYFIQIKCTAQFSMHLCFRFYEGCLII